MTARSSLNKAIAADGQRPLYHLARASLLIMTARPDESAADLNAGQKHDPGGYLSVGTSGQSEAVMWRQVLDQLAGRPHDTIHGDKYIFVPKFALEGTVQDWLNAGAKAGPIQQLVLHHMAKRWETVPDAIPILMKQARDMVAGGHAADALPILRQIGLVYREDDFPWLNTDAAAHLAAGNYALARGEYNRILISESDNYNAYLGHALTCAHVGAISRAKQDIAVAALLNPDAAAAFHQQHDAELGALQAAAPKDDPVTLGQQLLAAARAGEDDEKLVQRATALRMVMNDRRRVPEEQYISGLRRRLNAINANPKDAAGYAEMATYIYSEAIDKHGVGRSVPREWEQDRITAMTDADAALQLDPNNIQAMSTKGWLLEQDNQEKDALTIAQAGLQIEPGYPRLANLQNELLQVSALRAQGAAAAQRAPKHGMIVTPDVIITWTRGPSDAELAKARQYDAMSDANIATATSDLVTDWRKYRDDLVQMNVIADAMDYQGQHDDAINLWKKILTIDPNDATALGDLQDIYNDQHKDDDALEMESRLENVYATSTGPLGKKALAEAKAGNTPAAQADLERALAIDPADQRVYAELGNIHKDDPATMEPYIRCAIALSEAAARLNHQTFALGGTTSLIGSDSQLMMKLLQTQKDYFTKAGNAGAAEQAGKQAEEIARRVQADVLPAEFTAYSIGVGRLQWEKQLIANKEMTHAARLLLQAPSDNGSWHSEANAQESKIEYPVYRFLAPRLYHFQLWHFFGPGTLENYESAASNGDETPPPFHSPDAAE